jgi:hypothetical protein
VLNGLEFVDMRTGARISLQQFPWKQRGGGRSDHDFEHLFQFGKEAVRIPNANHFPCNTSANPLENLFII